MQRITLYDTTLRDGSQGEGVYFSLQDKLLITQELDRLGIDFIEGGYPLSNPKDEQYFAEVQRLELSHAKVVAFGMTRRRGVSAAEDTGMQALVAANTPVVTLVGKTWDLHVQEILRVDEAENLAMIRDSVAFLVQQGKQVFYDAEHFFDGLRRNRDFARRTLEAAADAGADTIILCDTNGGSLPEWVAEAVDIAKSTVSVPLGIHCHNDSDLATANSLRAVVAGATQVQGTINGIGERCGNADLVCIIANLALKYKDYQVLTPERLHRLTEVSRYVYDLANMNFRPGQPFVGSSAFAHKGGMHVHAVERNPVSYEHIDPTAVGNARKILISELAGRSNVLSLVGADHQLTDEQARAILLRVQDLENEGYQFESATGSFDLMVRKEIGKYTKYFTPISFRVNIEATDLIENKTTDIAATAISEATVKVQIGIRQEHTVAEGDGPVNALDASLRKALEPTYPCLRDMRLVDYKVRVVNPRAGTAARVRVTIQSQDENGSWGTVGVHENIVEASWRALVDAFEYQLQRAEPEPVSELTEIPS